MAADQLINYGIRIPPGKTGEVYTTCPECSHIRKKKTQKCLAVNVDEGLWICNHCGWSGSLKGNGKMEDSILETYDYTDESGTLLFQVVRKIPKGFYQRKPDGNGGWINSMGNVRRVIYRLPKVLEAIEKGKPIFIVEGEKDVHTLERLKLVGTCNPMGAGKWRVEYNRFLKNAEIIIIPDNDQEGKEHAQKVASFVYGEAKSIKIAELPGLPEKGDFTDWIKNGGTLDELEEIISKTPLYGFKGFRSYTAQELIEMEIPDPPWAVPGLLPIGLSILAGRPKSGKSWMGVSLCLSVSQGGKALSYFDTNQAQTLYIGLEDTPRRLQRRLRMLLQNESAPDTFHLANSIMSLNDGGESQLQWILKDNPEIKLVVIDTLERFAPRLNESNSNIVSQDYGLVSKLQKIATEFEIAILLIHHTRKSRSDIVIDEVLGTTGITAAADCIFVLRKTDYQTVLHVTGRDIDERQLAMRFDKTTGLWSVKGDAVQTIISDRKKEILDILKKNKTPLSTTELCSITDKNLNTVQRIIWELSQENMIEKIGHGNATKYKLMIEESENETIPF